MKLIQKIKNHFEKHSSEEEKVIETIEEIMDEREERGDDVLVDSEELLLLRNLFKLRDIRAGEIMIPRADIISISATATLADLRDIVIREKFTRLPVYDKSLDNVVGLVHVKDLLCQLFEHGRDTTVQEVMTHNVLFVPTSIRVLDLLREMQNKFTQIAIVIDEYGGTAGLITLEDLLEEIVGEIEDEHDALDTPPEIERLKNGAWGVDARIPLEELERTIGPFISEEEKDAEIDTVGGLVFHLAGRLPKRNEVIHHSSGVKFQVTRVDSRCIRKVKVTPTKKSSLPKKKTK